MAYISLYRKYRSQTFSDVVGQDHIVRTIRNAIKSNRIGQAYLFCGSRGTGKTTLARLIAKALNCLKADRSDPEPCNQCEACISVTDGSAMDVVEMDAASNRGVDDVDALRDGVKYPPMHLRYKVYIIDEAHQLSSAAKDAFLKTLEEPPAHAIFILATTESHKIPITIRSRCQQFDFRRGTVQEIAGRLEHVVRGEDATIAAEALELLARSANGSFRDGLSLLEQVLAFSEGDITPADVYNVLGMIDEDALLEIGGVIARGDSAQAFAVADKLLREGRDVRELVRSAAEFFRDLLMLKTGADKLHAKDQRWNELAGKFDQAQLVQIVEVFADTEKELRWNEHHRLALEMALLTAIQRLQPVQAVAQVTQAAVASLVRASGGAGAPAVPTVEPTAPAPSTVAQKDQGAGAPVPQVEPGELTLASITKLWPRVLLRLKKDMRKTGLAALLNSAKILSLDNETLALGFLQKFEFHRKGVEKDARSLSQAIKDLTGTAVRISAVTVDQPSAQPSEQKPVQQVEETSNPLEDEVLLRFGGDVMDKNDDNPWEE